MSDIFANDILIQLARAAHAGTSFSPDRRGDQEIADYVQTLQTDLKTLERYATTDEKRARLETEFARYREGYRRRFLVYLGAKSACVSTMIAGSSNFNFRRAQKRSASADKRTADLIEFRDRALAAIRKALTPELAPIMSGDADAVERLREKIAKLEKRQAHMKAVNAVIRKHAKTGTEAQVAALAILGCSEAIAREFLKPDFCGRVGFESFEMKNDGANIRRLKQRLAVVERAQAEVANEVVGKHARIEDCPSENRVRLYFSCKPTVEVRTRLKAGGFRWAPSMNAWSAYHNDNTLTLARELAGVEDQ